MTYGLKVVPSSSAEIKLNQSAASSCGNGSLIRESGAQRKAQRFEGRSGGFDQTADAGLRLIVERWEGLPAELQVKLVALVRDAADNHEA